MAAQEKEVPGESTVKTRKWSEIKARKFSPDELRQLDQEVEKELSKLAES
jgi:hypothetical protein